MRKISGRARPRSPSPSVLDARKTPRRLRQTNLTGARRPESGLKAAPTNELPRALSKRLTVPFRGSATGETARVLPHFVQKRALSLKVSAPHLGQAIPHESSRSQARKESLVTAPQIEENNEK